MNSWPNLLTSSRSVVARVAAGVVGRVASGARIHRRGVFSLKKETTGFVVAGLLAVVAVAPNAGAVAPVAAVVVVAVVAVVAAISRRSRRASGVVLARCARSGNWRHGCNGSVGDNSRDRRLAAKFGFDTTCESDGAFKSFRIQSSETLSDWAFQLSDEDAFGVTGDPFHAHVSFRVDP